MKLIFFICLGCFCFNHVILTSSDKIENENIPEEIFKSNELCSRMDSKTQLMDLNGDCQLLVLEQLDFVSLLSLAETNNQFKPLISIIVERIFRKNVVNIELKIESRSKDIIISDNKIEIKNATVAETVLSNFGHLIQNLQISRNYPGSDKSYRSIHKLVNLHCSKTLKEILLVNSMDNLLDEFTNQFENVKNVSILYVLATDRRLNEIFPSVRRLDFTILSISNTNSINVKYENLEHLKLFLNGPLKEELITEIIRKNSHIRSLTLPHTSPELIKIAADSLPQLERFKFDSIENKYNNESIVVSNVKIFETKSYCVKSLFLNNIKFTNVEELHTDGLAESMFGETGFFASNTNLKKLQLESELGSISLDADGFKQLARANSTLQDIFISRAAGVEVEMILQLIENNEQLQKLHITFSFNDDRETTLEALSRNIDNRWSMEAFSDTIILKKNHIPF